MKEARVAVIGAGYLGSIHAEKYKKLAGVKLAGVCDIDADKARRTARGLRCEPFTDYNELIGKVDAVSIAVPTHLHYEIAKKFLEGGADVLIEKPITKTVGEAKGLIELAASKKRIIQVGHIERFNSAIRAVEGSLDNPRFIECHRLSPFKGRGIEVGVTLDLMIHDIDVVLGWVRSDIENIEAVGVNVLSASEDIANARLKFANGAICNLTASRVANKNMRKIRIFQHDTYISLDYLKRSVRVYTKSAGKIKSSRLGVRRGDPLREQLESFIECTRDRNRPIVSGEEGLKALDVALGIQSQINKSL